MVRMPGMNLFDALRPWSEVVLEQVPGLELFDAHTHLGQNDPDGMKQTPEELISALRAADAKGAFTFPFHEPDGYRAANDAVIEAAGASDGLLVPFCRVNPHDDPLPEAERSLQNGAQGIKLHPRAEEFTLDHPAVKPLIALADERSLPVLIHAGRGIPALGLHAVQLAEEFPNARLILAHAGICDLSWIWRVAADLPNLLFDTAWWIPTDFETLFSLVPPGQIVFASDAPYGSTFLSAAFQLRWALQLGFSADQIRSIAAGQSLRLAAGEPLQPCGPAIGEREKAPHLLLDRVAYFLLFSAMGTMRGVDPTEMLALARLACDVPEEIDDAPVFAAIVQLLDDFEAYAADAGRDAEGVVGAARGVNPDSRRAITFLILAATVARTPDVPIPPAVVERTRDSAPRSAAARSA
jgi:uncharacterized protein